LFQASEVRAAWSRGHNALRCGAAGGVSWGPKGGYFYTLQREGGGMEGSGKMGQKSSNKKPESVGKKGGVGWINTDLDI